VIPDWRIFVVGVAAGLALGSFTVTAALRTARAAPAFGGRSRCDACGKVLGYAATFPVLSYAVLRGACATCRSRIDPLHPLGELAGAAVIVCALTLAAPGRVLAAAALGLVLLASSTIDARTRKLPDPLTAAAAALACVLAATRTPEALAIGVLWAAGTGATLWLLRRGLTGQQSGPAMGLGDIKLAAALALWLGSATPWMIVAGSFLGLAAHALLRPTDRRLAFGPALAAAGFGAGMLMEHGIWLPT
jgi:leader peptidase (prepilin peptidase)/N-methyltransferase